MFQRLATVASQPPSSWGDEREAADHALAALVVAVEEAGYLAGYLSGLMAKRPVVSVVAGPPSPPVNALARGFARGAREARPGIAVLIGHASSITDQAVCERIANRQIDRSSTVVFEASGGWGRTPIAPISDRTSWSPR